MELFGKTAKIFIAGHTGMVGSAILRHLIYNGYSNLIVRTSKELDLTSQKQVTTFFATEKPNYVFIAAAKVGGIMANENFRADFLYENLIIQTNVIHSACEYKVRKLLFMGSSCIYPKLAPQPLKEEYLMTGKLEPTNDAYAIAKISGIKMCDAYRRQYGCNFISVMPTSLYGPNDHYDAENSHVIPALFRKVITAKREDAPFITVWGSGSPKREFLHVDDMAEACAFLMKNYDEPGIINIGIGEDISILDLTKLIMKIVDYKGKIVHDLEKPDGTPRKLMDVTRINNLGWKASTALEEGLRQVYREITDLQII